jgi:hypothetical protein
VAAAAAMMPIVLTAQLMRLPFTGFLLALRFAIPSVQQAPQEFVYTSMQEEKWRDKRRSKKPVKRGKSLNSGV